MQLVRLFHNVYSLWLAHLKIVFSLCECNALFRLFQFRCVDQMWGRVSWNVTVWMCNGSVHCSCMTCFTNVACCRVPLSVCGWILGVSHLFECHFRNICFFFFQLLRFLTFSMLNSKRSYALQWMALLVKVTADIALCGSCTKIKIPPYSCGWIWLQIHSAGASNNVLLGLPGLILIPVWWTVVCILLNVVIRTDG